MMSDSLLSHKEEEEKEEDRVSNDGVITLESYLLATVIESPTPLVLSSGNKRKLADSQSFAKSASFDDPSPKRCRHEEPTTTAATSFPLVANNKDSKCVQIQFPYHEISLLSVTLPKTPQQEEQYERLSKHPVGKCYIFCSPDLQKEKKEKEDLQERVVMTITPATTPTTNIPLFHSPPPTTLIGGGTKVMNSFDFLRFATLKGLSLSTYATLEDAFSPLLPHTQCYPFLTPLVMPQNMTGYKIKSYRVRNIPLSKLMYVYIILWYLTFSFLGFLH